jgi:prolyl 4-hydroxylase
MGDLNHYIRSYDHNLDASFCQRLIDSFEAGSRFQQRNGRGLRAGLEESAWTELNVTRLADASLLNSFRELIDAALARYNRDVGLAIPIPNSAHTSDLIMKRYCVGKEEQFQLHFDAINHVANRYLVMIWYLNDVARGGQTQFPQLHTAVSPQAGRLLMFPPYWMYQHEGIPPLSGDKYIISTYLLFQNPQPS